MKPDAYVQSVAEEAVEQELLDHRVELNTALEALGAAAELARYRRSHWETPRDAWGWTVYAVALCLQRVGGALCQKGTEAESVATVREAIQKAQALAQRTGRAPRLVTPGDRTP